jgi:hypothetical protein
MPLSHAYEVTEERIAGWPFNNGGIGPCRGFSLILLQKSKVAGLRFFRENTKGQAITDSYNLNRFAEVACESNVRR